MEKEKLLHYVWMGRVCTGRIWYTTSGMETEVLHPGQSNPNAGPDFVNARIRLDRLVWAGNVEIHVKASDWNRHGHHSDPLYNNVILHVVGEFDTDVHDSQGRMIPTLELRKLPEKKSGSRSPCRSSIRQTCGRIIPDVPERIYRSWIASLYNERILGRCLRIRHIAQNASFSWEEIFYRILASGYGLPINKLPFEMLAERIKLENLMELRDDPVELESVFFGKAGFLQPGFDLGCYGTMLHNTYKCLENRMPGTAIPCHLWKFLRLRPASFPTLRISQFANLIHRRFPMVDEILEIKELYELEQLLRITASEYWNTHYLFGRYSPETEKTTGLQFIRSLIINAIVPFYNAYGIAHNQPSFVKKGRLIMLQLEPEFNHIIKNWTKFGIRSRNAMESQALIQLTQKYCYQGRCEECGFGIFYRTGSL